MTANTPKTLPQLRAGTQQPEPAGAAATSVETGADVAAPELLDECITGGGKGATFGGARLRDAAPRKRMTPSAEPLARFRASGVATWDKALDYEWAATFCVGHFGLVNATQLAEWVFKDLATPAARHRQAQALTLRLCPQARKCSRAQRLASAGHRPVLRTLGRKKVGNCFYYYLNTAGLRHMRENYGLVLADASKSLTTSNDIAKRTLVFEHFLALYRANSDLSFVGPAALAADVAVQQTTDPVKRALLNCLSNLWGVISTQPKLTYLYVADRPGSSNAANVAHYRELAKATTRLLGHDVSIEVIGRRMPTETDSPLTHTQLAQSVVTASTKEVFWTKKTGYQVDKLVRFFTSLKPHAARIRMLLVRDHA
jgi:hypothetical protein